MPEEQRWIGNVGENEVLQRELVRDESDVEEMQIETWFKYSISFSFSVCFTLVGMLCGFLKCMILPL